MQKPSIPKGTRDFSLKKWRNVIIFLTQLKRSTDSMVSVKLKHLLWKTCQLWWGKYGEEGDKLLFKILNSGDFLKDISKDDLTEGNSVKTANKISEKGLRYDLTVPLHAM